MKIQYTVASPKAKLIDTIGYSLISKITSNDVYNFKGSNTDSLAKVYNKSIARAKNDNCDAIVFVHDDVIINCNDVSKRIQQYLEKFDVFGLAGTNQITIKEPVLWHLMSERKHHLGCVAHTHGEQYFYTSFGPIPGRAILIDGVFMAVNLHKLPDSVRFDESNPAKFHFYDLMFSLDCSLNKVKVGVGDIPIIHASPGLREMSDEWKNGQKYFLTKYNKYINKTLTV